MSIKKDNSIIVSQLWTALGLYQAKHAATMLNLPLFTHLLALPGDLEPRTNNHHDVDRALQLGRGQGAGRPARLRAANCLWSAATAGVVPREPTISRETSPARCPARPAHHLDGGLPVPAGELALGRVLRCHRLRPSTTQSFHGGQCRLRPHRIFPRQLGLLRPWGACGRIAVLPQRHAHGLLLGQPDNGGRPEPARRWPGRRRLGPRKLGRDQPGRLRVRDGQFGERGLLDDALTAVSHRSEAISPSPSPSCRRCRNFYWQHCDARRAAGGGPG